MSCLFRYQLISTIFLPDSSIYSDYFGVSFILVDSRASMTDYVIRDWIPKDDTYFTRNVSSLSRGPIPFLIFMQMRFYRPLLRRFLLCLYTHGSDLQKVLHTDYCQISRLPIAIPIGALPTGMVAITAWLSVAMTVTLWLSAFAT
jgi:hypothetical protein